MAKLSGARPITAALLGGVADDEPAAALATRVHDRALSRGYELLEHLSAEALDVLNGKSAGIRRRVSATPEQSEHADG